VGVLGQRTATGSGVVVQLRFGHGQIHLPRRALELARIGLAAFGREGEPGGALLSL
jgi:hypothetical protein